MEELLGETRTPRKKALLIGINYVGLAAQLSGCVNDVADMLDVCRALGYTDVRVLYDGEWPGPGAPPPAPPTRANMTAAFRWLAADAGAGDRLLFHYSGHGGQLRALKPGSEATGMDDTVVPVDYETAGMMRDDELYELLVVPLRGTGASLRGVLDCCHSGTGLDLKYNLSLGLFSRDAGAAAPGSLRPLVAQIVEDCVRAELVRWFGEEAVARRLGAPGAEFVEWGDGLAAAPLTAEAVEGRALGAAHALAPDALLVSGCGDLQTSADASFGGRANGALTHHVLALLAPAVAGGAWPTATAFLRELRRRLRAGGYDQVPQVSSETPVNGKTRFNLV